jgi:hypothetical protein
MVDPAWAATQAARGQTDGAPMMSAEKALMTHAELITALAAAASKALKAGVSKDDVHAARVSVRTRRTNGTKVLQALWR